MTSSAPVAPTLPSPRHRPAFAWAGVVGPVVLDLVFTALGARRSGYSARRDFISALSLGDAGWIQKLNFVVAGILILLFATAVRSVFAEGRGSRTAPALFATIGGCLVGAGLFDMDAMGASTLTLHGVLHNLFAGACFGAMPMACLVVASRLRGQPFAVVSTVAGVVVAALFFGVVLGFSAPGFGPIVDLSSSIGLMQRADQGVFFGWTVAFALGLWKSPETSSGPVEPRVLE